jgi:hypothetical protein
MIKLVPQDADGTSFRRTAGIFQWMPAAFLRRKLFAKAGEEVEPSIL